MTATKRHELENIIGFLKETFWKESVWLRVDRWIMMDPNDGDHQCLSCGDRTAKNFDRLDRYTCTLGKDGMKSDGFLTDCIQVGERKQQARVRIWTDVSQFGP